MFTSELKEKSGSVDWMEVDRYRFVSLCRLLKQLDLLILPEVSGGGQIEIENGSLLDETKLKQICRIWHELPPWPDTCSGLDLLNKRFKTVTLSNTYNDLMKHMVAYSSIPFQYVYTADMFQSYKPNSKVYLGAAEKLGVKPEECGLVAAHLNDLQGAKACGFYAIYVERPLEEKNPDLRDKDIPDMVIKEDENGFETVAHRLGIRST